MGHSVMEKQANYSGVGKQTNKKINPKLREIILLQQSVMLDSFRQNKKYINLPVFGTEEALVEPMLLALDTTEPFLTVSAKKPAEQDGIYVKLQDKEQMKTLPSSTASSGMGEDDRKLTGVKVAEGTVCLPSHRQAAAKEGERTKWTLRSWNHTRKIVPAKIHPQ